MVESDAGHGAGGVGAEAGQSEEGLLCGWDLSAQVLQDDLGGGVQVASPGIIPHARPEPENPLERGSGQVGERGEGLKEAIVIGKNRLDAGLLEHELRDHDFIWVPGFPPGEVSFVTGVPAEKRALEGSLLRQGVKE